MKEKKSTILLYIETPDRLSHLVLRQKDNALDNTKELKDFIKKSVKPIAPNQEGASDVTHENLKSNLNLTTFFLFKKEFENEPNKKAYEMTMFKFIGKKRGCCIFFVFLKSIPQGKKWGKFDELEKENKQYKIGVRKANRDSKKLKKGKSQAKRHVSRLKPRNFVDNAVFTSLLSLFLSIFLYLTQNPDHKRYLWRYILFFLASFIIVFFIALLIQTTFNRIYFFRRFKHVVKAKGESKQEIDNKLKNKKNISESYHGFCFLDFLNGESFMISDDQNKKFTVNSRTIHVYIKHPRLSLGIFYKIFKYFQPLTEEHILSLAYVVSSKIDNHKTIFNGQLLGANSELLFDECKTFDIKRASYYDYISIDEMIYRNLTLDNDPNYYLKGTDICLNQQTGGLHNIVNSALTNIIGVNIIVELVVEETQKSWLIVNMQSTYNDVNQQKLCPSGSGSLGYQDFYKCKKRHKHEDINFEELLQEGMYRELSEESYIDRDWLEKHDVEFKLLGFSRLVSKAGKPDFFGKVTVRITEAERQERLRHFNEEQHRLLTEDKNNKYALESFYLLMVDKEEFLGKEKELYWAPTHIDFGHYRIGGSETYLSPQLAYTKYLLIRE